MMMLMMMSMMMLMMMMLIIIMLQMMTLCVVEYSQTITNLQYGLSGDINVWNHHIWNQAKIIIISVLSFFYDFLMRSVHLADFFYNLLMRQLHVAQPGVSDQDRLGNPEVARLFVTKHIFQ